MSEPHNRFLDPRFECLCGAALPPAEAVDADALDLPLCGGQTPLTRAVSQGDRAGVQGLLDLGADPSRADATGATPLVTAALRNEYAIAEHLAQAGADLDAGDLNGRAAVHYAAFFGHVEFTAWLKARGARLGGVDADGRTPLDYARSAVQGKKDRRLLDLFVGSPVGDSSVDQRRASPLRADARYLRLDHLQFAGTADAVGKKLYWLVGALVLGFVVSISLLETPVVLALVAVLAPFIIFAWPQLSHTRDLLNREPGEAPPGEGALQGATTSARWVAGLLRQGHVAVNAEFARRGQQRPPSALADYAAPAVVLTVMPYVALTVAATWAAGVGLLASTLGESVGALVHALLDIPLIGWLLFIALSMVGLLLLVVVTLGPAFYLAGWVLQLGYRGLMRPIRASLVASQQDFARDIQAQLQRFEQADELTRDNILFLRPFVQDDSLRLGPFRFEALLAYSLSQTAPLVAIGYDDSSLGPAGIQATDDNWRERVTRLANQARLIVMIPHHSEGVRWEMTHLLDAGHLGKTVFLAPPSSRDMSTGDDWEAMRRHPGLAALEIPPYCRDGFVFTLDANGRIASWGPVGLTPAWQLKLPQSAETKPDGGDGSEGGDGGSSASSTYTNAQAAMAATAVVTAAEFGAASGDDGGDGGDGGGDGGGGAG